MGTLKRHLSPGAAIGVVALVFALGGVGYAASKINTSDIKRGAVTKPKLDGKAVAKSKIAKAAVASGKIADEAVSSEKLGDGAVSTDKLGSEAVSTEKIADEAVSNSKVSHPTYWALVREGIPPTLARASGATEAFRINAGNYRVEFESEIDECSYQATPANVNDNLTAAADAFVLDANQVFVSLRDPSTGNRTDGDFNLAVHC